MDKFKPGDYTATAERARPATLSEQDDLLLDCYEAASSDGAAGWTVFQIVEAFVFDHTHYSKEKA